MLQIVDVGPQAIEPYAEFIGEAGIERLRAAAAKLSGARILQLNATSYGGGVAELLNSIVPLERGLGLDVTWGTIVGDAPFFAFTKRLHNALQGAPDFEFSDAELGAYMRHNADLARAVRDHYDIVIVHDPQPLPVRALGGDTGGRWIWRAHIDMSNYNEDAWQFLRSFVEPFETYVFTLPEFVPAAVDPKKVRVVAPAIDPLSPKNFPLSQAMCERIVAWFGIDPARPLITQVSRFDPWKDPLGVIEVFRELRHAHPDLQLALLASMATDDPEGWQVYEQVIAAAGDDPDIHIRTNLNGIGNIEINAFQRHSRVIVQKSVREGFGLVVAEALWKETPVVASQTGGIPMQLRDGEGGYLVSEAGGWRHRIHELLEDPEAAREIGRLGRPRVQEQFLITRLLQDDLHLMSGASDD